ncbi:unnamed protein product, partial [Ectocarpus sp. 13 AM-2016]
MAEGGERLQATAHREYHQLWGGPGAQRYHGRSVFFGHVFLAPARIARLHGLFTVQRSRRLATFVACRRSPAGVRAGGRGGARGGGGGGAYLELPPARSGE